jgi:hypothetical protein
MMSVWSGVEGTIKVRKDNHLSVSKVIGDVWDEVSKPSINKTEGNTYFYYSIAFNYCDDGEGAVKSFKKFLSILISYGCEVDLNNSVRWLGINIK